MKSRIVRRLRRARYSMLGISVVMGITLISASLNNARINEEIRDIESKTTKLAQKRLFMEIFEQPYLESDDALVYKTHANHLPTPTSGSLPELVIHVTYPEPTPPVKPRTIYEQDLSPQEARRVFLDNMLADFITKIHT